MALECSQTSRSGDGPTRAGRDQAAFLAAAQRRFWASEMRRRPAGLNLLLLRPCVMLVTFAGFDLVVSRLCPPVLDWGSSSTSALIARSKRFRSSSNSEIVFFKFICNSHPLTRVIGLDAEECRLDDAGMRNFHTRLRLSRLASTKQAGGNAGLSYSTECLRIRVNVVFDALKR